MAARQARLRRALVVAALLLWSTSSHGLPADPRQPAPWPAENANVQRSAPVPAAQRIVSLVPALTEMLFALGAGAQVIGVSSYDDFPADVKSLPRLGALLDPDTERILSLRPDLVIVYGSQIDLEATFARAGIRTYAYRHAGIANVLQTIRDLASVTGHVDEGTRVVRQLQAQVDGVRTRVRGLPRPRTMIVMGRDALALRGLFASAGVGFLHELLEVAGGDDVFGDVKREGVQPSNETMIVRAPQVIIELHAGEPPSPDVLGRERAVWLQLPSIPAVRNGRVYFLYGGYLVTPGPRLGLAAEALARVLHPGAF